MPSTSFRKPPTASRMPSTTFRTLAAGTCAALITVLTAGCGAGSRTTGADVTCNVDAPARQTEVQLLAYSSPAMDPFSSAMTKGCAGVDNLSVKHSPVDFGAQLEKAQLSLSQKRGDYDIVEVYSGTLPQYADAGWLQPLDGFYKKYAKRYGLSGIDPELLDLARYKGKLYALPMQVNVHVMAYRKDILKSLGIQPPRTLDELTAAAEKIKARTKMKHPLAASFSADADITTAYNNSLTSLGGEWLDEKTDKPKLTSPESVAAVKSLQRMLPHLPKDALSANVASVTTRMQNGGAAIGILYSGSMASIDNPKISKAAGKFGFTRAPSVEAGGGPWATLNMDGFSVAKNSADDDELLFQVAAIGSGQDAADSAGKLAHSAREQVRKKLAPEAPYLEAGESTIDKGARPYPAKPYFVTLQTAVRPFIADAVSGRMPVKEALAKAQREAERVVDRY
jgi:multiple sugar transport system substrate-binding protein